MIRIGVDLLMLVAVPDPAQTAAQVAAVTSRDVTLALIGGLIGFASSLLTALLTYYLAGKRLRLQIAREDELRREQRDRENDLRNQEREREDKLRQEERERENQLRKEEREREDSLRKEEREREDELRRQERRRESVLRESDNLWRDIERMEERLKELTPNDLNERNRLQKDLAEWSRRRALLLKEEHSLLPKFPPRSG